MVTWTFAVRLAPSADESVSQPPKLRRRTECGLGQACVLERRRFGQIGPPYLAGLLVHGAIWLYPADNVKYFAVHSCAIDVRA